MPPSPRPHPRPLPGLNRRQFLTASLAAGAALALAPGRTARAAVSTAGGRKLRLAVIGIGNRGNDLIKAFRDTGLVEFTAFCDVDPLGAHTAEARQLFPAVPVVRDFRELFARLGDRFEAVVVATPDHTHFVQAMHALRAGKHVYVEKPLAHTFQEVELLMAAAARAGVVTQMGNQGHSGNNYHQFKAWTEAGIIRDVTKVVMHMNAPRRWHGWQVEGFPAGEALPPELDWENWTGPAEAHPFSARLHPGNWRSWFAYGNGAFGDWGPHILDTCHRFLRLGLPRVIEAERRDGPNAFIFPQASTIRFDFAARGEAPPVEVFWFDGVENLPPLPAELGPAAKDPGRKSGKFIFSREFVFQGGTHGETLRILPESRMRAEAPRLPKITGGFSDHFQNFALACLGEEEPRSPFHVSGPLTQVFLLGVIAQRLGGRLEFDPVRREFVGHARANALLRSAPARPGWEDYYAL